MSSLSDQRQFYAETYDAAVPDWPGEIDFYRAMVARVVTPHRGVLELACGTGRVALRLAQDGVAVVGLDLSPAMLDVARQKSLGVANVRWVEGDMRSFTLDEIFSLVIMPGHAFQNLLTSQDQFACLACIRGHLAPGGKLVVHLDHLDVSWLGKLRGQKSGVFEAVGQFPHPATGDPIRTLRAWTYEPATQTAVVQTAWEELGADGQVVSRRESGPVRLHCVFRFEMAHLLARAGFDVEAVYGDFHGRELQDESSEMVWVAQIPERADQRIGAG